MASFARKAARARTRALLLSIGAGVALAGCEQPKPRTFLEFMEDDFARDGVLARCNDEQDDGISELECSNARRAAMAIALSEEQARREQLEQESERLRAELRRRIALQQEAEERATAAARAAEQERYEAQWSDGVEAPPADDSGMLSAEEPLAPDAAAAHEDEVVAAND